MTTIAFPFLEAWGLREVEEGGGAGVGRVMALTDPVIATSIHSHTKASSAKLNTKKAEMNIYTTIKFNSGVNEESMFDFKPSELIDTGEHLRGVVTSRCLGRVNSSLVTGSRTCPPGGTTTHAHKGGYFHQHLVTNTMDEYFIHYKIYQRNNIYNNNPL